MPQIATVVRLQRWRACLVALGILLMFAAGAPDCVAQTRRIILVGSDEIGMSQYGRWLDMTYREAFLRLGYTFEYQTYPAARASALSDQGLVDGEIHRVGDYAKDHPNLIRLTEPNFPLTFAAYSIKPIVLQTGWSNLAGRDFRVAYRLGVRQCETKLPALIDKERLSFVRSAELGLQRLMQGETDIFIDVDYAVDPFLKRGGSLAATIHKITIVESVQAYAFLHKKNEQLVPALSAMLTKMRREGLIERYRIETLDKTSAQGN
jgi:polar amino acid transport system substrate-binding protein